MASVPFPASVPERCCVVPEKVRVPLVLTVVVPDRETVVLVIVRAPVVAATVRFPVNVVVVPLKVPIPVIVMAPPVGQSKAPVNVTISEELVDEKDPFIVAWPPIVRMALFINRVEPASMSRRSLTV